MSHYHDPGDAKYRDQMLEHAPVEYKALGGLMRAIARDDGAIPPKYRELIAIAVAHATACPYCIESHVKQGKKHQITKAELGEAIMISAALSAGAAAAHGGMAYKFFDRED